MTIDPRRIGIPPQVWTRVPFGSGSLRSVRNAASGRVDCCLFDALHALGVQPADYHHWTDRLRFSGKPVRITIVRDCFEVLTPQASIRWLLDTYMHPSARRRTLYAQMRRAVREASA